MAGLVKDKDAILNSLDSVSVLAQQTADLTTGIRPGLVQDVKELRQVATNLNQGRDEIDRALQILPIKLREDRPDGDLRLVLQLLPVQVHRQGDPARPARSTVPYNTYPLRQREVQPLVTTPFRERNPVKVGAVSLLVLVAARPDGLQGRLAAR